MRIVSVNAWGGALADDLLSWIADDPADVLCLQEVPRIPGGSGWTQFADGERTLPQRADLFADVSSALPHHQGLFVASDSGPVTDADGRPRQQQFGVATFVSDAVPLVGVESAFVHGRYVAHRQWPRGDRPRAALAVRLAIEATRFITVVQLHGLRDPAGKQDTPAREGQAHRLADLVTHARGPGDLTVVCGDLNLLPTSHTFQVLAGIGLTDLVGSADTRTSRYPKPTRHASYLLISEPDAARTFTIPAHPEVSDHRPLVLEIWSRPAVDSGRSRSSGAVMTVHAVPSGHPVEGLMPRYVFLIVENEGGYADAHPAEMEKVMAMHQDFATAVASSGATLHGGEALQPTPTARYLRGTRTDGVAVVDAPNPELKEVLGGYYLVEAADDEQALELAKLCPAPHGYVEVRPVWEFSNPQ